MMDEFQLLKQRLPRVKRNVFLKKYTTFKIGGRTKYFFVARTTEQIEKAVRAARRLKTPSFILGHGSNVLMADNGFPGLVIKIQNSKFKIPARHASRSLRGVAGGQNTSIWAEAGVEVSTLVKETGKRGLSGLEWAGGLPGTLGGAIRGNAGAFVGEIKDCVEIVEALDGQGNRNTFSKKQCKFAYRSSVFKEKNYVVLSATLQLRKGNKKEIQAIAKDHIRYRKERHPLEYPNAGSIFKNCDLKKVPQKIQQEFKDVIKQDPFPVIPTAALIARANLQGLRVGDAQVSPKHPNYMVNLGNATAADVLQLIANVKKQIKKKFGIDLEEEIQFVA